MVPEEGGKLFLECIDLSTNVKGLFEYFDGMVQKGIDGHMRDNKESQQIVNGEHSSGLLTQFVNLCNRLSDR